MISVVAVLRTLRQQRKTTGEKRRYSLADFVLPRKDDVIDYVYKKYGDGRPLDADTAAETVDLSRVGTAEDT
mgnify:CR=1 FL=1